MMINVSRGAEAQIDKIVGAYTESINGRHVVHIRGYIGRYIVHFESAIRAKMFLSAIMASDTGSLREFGIFPQKNFDGETVLIFSDTTIPKIEIFDNR